MVMRTYRAGLAAGLMAGTMLAAAAGPAVAETEFIARIYNAGTDGSMTLADGSTETPLL